MLNVNLNIETPWSSGVALKIITTLGGSANTLVVGGAVRNWLIDENVNDIDFASKFLPKKSMKLLSEKGFIVKPIGIEHGTIAVYKNNKVYEITTLRKDIITDGRHAKVLFGTDWKEDALRRDFTINALYADQFGNVMDPTGLGYKDLEDKKLRFIGCAEERIKEDYLRILRYFRFLNKFSTDIHKESYDACLKFSNGIKSLSGERILTEFSKIFEDKNFAKSMTVCLDENLFRFVYSLEYLNNLKINKKIWNRILKIISKEKNSIINPFLFLSCFLLTFIKNENIDHVILVKNISNRLKISKYEQNFMIKIIYWIKNIENITKHEIYKVWLDLGEKSINHLKLIYQIFDFKYSDEVTIALNNKPKSFACSGEDAKNIGLKEGKKIGKLLNDVRDWWIDKDCKPSYDECLKILEKKSKKIL